MGLGGLVACFIAINAVENSTMWNLKLIGWKSVIMTNIV